MYILIYHVAHNMGDEFFIVDRLAKPRFFPSLYNI